MGRFEIERRVAAGGMGTVFRARDSTTGTIVALKILRDIDEGARARLNREAHALAEVMHPRIVRYVAHGVLDSGEPYLAMEWIEGETLAERLRRAPLSTSEGIEVVRLAAEALGHLHARGVVHRDIKPGNLVLRGDRIDGVTLVDFGLARDAGEISFQSAGTIVGTPAFMAPEQARGGRDIGPEADVFALGGVLFRCVTGRNAFVGTDSLAVLAKVLLDTPPRAIELVPTLDPLVDEAIGRMLEKEPERRPRDGASVAAMLGALGRVGDVEPAAEDVAPARFGLVERKLQTVVLAPTDFDPEATTARDSGGLGEIRRVIARRGGAQCDVLANGAVIVTITAGDSAKEQAAKAAACALDLQPLVDVPIAIATGYDVFDQAARLARAGVGTRDIFVDDTTAALLAERYTVERNATGIVLRAASSADDTGRTLLGKARAFVGRDRELVTLEAVFDECRRERTARVVLVTGPPGIGKSRLRRELLARLVSSGRDLTALVGAADPFSRAPFVMLARAVGSALGADTLVSRVRSVVGAADAERVADFMLEMCALDGGAPSSHRVAARADPVLMHEQTRRAFCDFLASECARRPVVLALDDVQWADALSTRLVDAALGALAEQPLMLLAFARPEISETAPKLWESRGVLPLPLGALSRRAASELVRTVLSDASRARGLSAETDQAVERVVSRAAGNALYLEELIRAEDAGRGSDPPDTVLAMVQSRLSRLDAETRRVLRAASIFAGTFSQTGVQAVLADEDPNAIAAHVEFLLRSEFLSRTRASTPSDGDIVFRHALVRDAAYAMLTEDDAKLGHGLAAAHLEREGAAPVVVAEHYARSSEPTRAVPPLLRAAHVALDASDFSSALGLTARARALDSARAVTAACALVEAEAHRWLGATAKAFDAAGEALACLDLNDPARFSALRARAYGASHLGWLAELDAVAEELLSSEPSDDAARAYLFAVSQAAASLVVVGKLEVGERLLSKAHARFERFQRDPAVVARFLEARVACASHAGNLELLLATADAARSNAEIAGDERSEIVETVNGGFALMQLGAYEESLRAFERARADSERLGLVTNRRSAMQNAGYVMLRLGRVNEARDIEQAVLAEIGGAASPRLVTLTRACLALIELRAGDVAAARVHALAAVDAATGPPQRAYAETALGEVMLASSEHAAAIAHADRALEIMKTTGGFHFAEATALLVRAVALHASGNLDEARIAIARAEARLNERANKVSLLRRAQFLSRVDENRKTIELAQNWSDADSEK